MGSISKPELVIGCVQSDLKRDMDKQLKRVDAMTRPYSNPNPKTDAAAQQQTRADGSPINDDRAEIGPTQKAFAEWAALGLTPPNLKKMRQGRLDRLCGELKKRDLDGVLLFDPLNIRYATDSTNMQIWTAHDFSRAAFITADGYIILWEFDRCEHLSAHLTLISERRTGAGGFYFPHGDKATEYAAKFAHEVQSVMAEHRIKRMAADKMDFEVAFALRDLGIDLYNGQEVLEHARLIKSDEEIRAMRCSIATCEAAIDEMHAAFEPGISEVELWSHFHAGNIARGGEWIETRLFASGPRTNPWMQEAGPRIIQPGDILAFDTDMIGPYGVICDISRSWLCGDQDATAEQKLLHRVAHDHITENMDLLRPGVSFRDLTFKGHMLPEEYVPQRYCLKMHGVGMCDEFPAIYYPEDFIEGAFDYHLEPGMILTVEAYIGAVGGREGIKLEDHIRVTESAPERMTTYPFDAKLM